ncbi:MAG: YdiU family protein [Verrucomicrobiota bacterium]
MDANARLFDFDNTYERLPKRFYAKVRPTPVAAPKLIALNRELCAQLEIDPVRLEADAAAICSGNVVPEGASSIAMAYAGHQFGGFVPQLGDGRAILLGEVIARDGRRFDLQWKGAGPTPFSRRGDGRAALGPVLREFLVSEAMTALGIPSTRALAAVLTGEPVYRETVLPGAVLTRVAASHIRVGTFEYFAERNDRDALNLLVTYALQRHYPDLLSARSPALALLEAVAERQASLIARWMHVGFIHGVMNTDNSSISGETIDFGPCALMDEYDPGTVFSAIDRQGRYAYVNQPAIAQWNLARLAETLLPLIDAEQERSIELATEVIHRMPALYERQWLAGMRQKLGLESTEPEDLMLSQSCLKAMHEGGADFTLFFRRLCGATENQAAAQNVRSLFQRPELYDDWATQWQARQQKEARPAPERAAMMRSVNPALIPRNHCVEQALRAAIDGDFSEFENLRNALAAPFEERSASEKYTTPPAPHERVLNTFCGT